MTIAILLLSVLAFGGAAFAFVGGDERAAKRVTAIAKPASGRNQKSQAEAASQKRKNVSAML